MYKNSCHSDIQQLVFTWTEPDKISAYKYGKMKGTMGGRME
jgi:hypothetical protein